MKKLLIRELKIIIEPMFLSRTGFLAEKAATRQGAGALAFFLLAMPVPAAPALSSSQAHARTDHRFARHQSRDVDKTATGKSKL